MKVFRNFAMSLFARRVILLFFALVALAQATYAVTPFTVRDIRIEGLQRVEPGTVFVSLPFQIGDEYNDEKGTLAIRNLFGLGLFKDVRIEVNGDVLLVVVEERPTLAAVNFVGTKEFDAEALTKALKDIGLADGRAFDTALLDRAEQELKRQYINRGLYAVGVITTVTPIERNRVNLTFNVSEGQPSRISEIQIVGNKAFSQSTLLDQFDQDTGGWLSWYTKSNLYTRVKLNADLEALKSYYLTRGFLEFRIDSTQVSILPNKTDISITINITEGARYLVSAVELKGDYLSRDDEFKTMVKVKPGLPYNADDVATTTRAFIEYFGNFGYAFARVEALPDVDRVNNRVKLVLQANPSRRAYVRRINVAGNSRTRDEVVRREFRQLESSWYDADRIRRSRDRVDRLGFFGEVAIETKEVPGAPDQVDLVVNVVEKPTGSLSLGAGYSSGDGLGLTFGINQQNAFGSGNSLGIQVNTSKINKVLDISSTDPYFTADGVSRTFGIYHRNTSPYQDPAFYKLVSTGASLRFGVPFTELDTVFFGAGVESTNIQSGTGLPSTYLTYVNDYGASSTSLPITVGWARDNRDSALVPTRGRLQQVNFEWSPAGDATYVKGSYQFQQYLPLTNKFTVAFKTDLGAGSTIGERVFPIFKSFFGGGLGSVRGFEQGSLGPRDAGGTVLGGTGKFNANLELQAPLPGAGNDRTLRMFGFVDMGLISGPGGVNPDANNLRSSTGVGLSWVSPVGPLKLSFAKPIKKFDGDKIQSLQFQIGTSF